MHYCKSVSFISGIIYDDAVKPRKLRQLIYVAHNALEDNTGIDFLKYRYSLLQFFLFRHYS